MTKYTKAIRKEWRILEVKRKIGSIQKEIKKNTDFQHYKSKYIKKETNGWEKIALWLYQTYKKQPGKKILDIGCYVGTLAIFCAKELKADVSGMDWTKEFYPKELFKKYNIKHKIAVLEDDPIPYKEKFDVVIFTEVLEHLIYAPVPTLKKIKGALAKDGILYLSTPNGEKWGKIDLYEKLSDIPEKGSKKKPKTNNYEHIWQYRLPELLYVIEKAGLAVVKFDYSNGEKQFNLALKRKEDVII